MFFIKITVTCSFVRNSKMQRDKSHDRRKTTLTTIEKKNTSLPPHKQKKDLKKPKPT
jgi:hypothetical protein